jgi:hypothetical protein
MVGKVNFRRSVTFISTSVIIILDAIDPAVSIAIQDLTVSE